jgi:hypothetical protein
MDLEKITVLTFRLEFPPPNTNCFRDRVLVVSLFTAGVAYECIYLFYCQIVLNPHSVVCKLMATEVDIGYISATQPHARPIKSTELPLCTTKNY